MTTPVTLALHAMATRFELVLHGSNPANLRAAGEEALLEIERLEARLSLYRPGSDIAQVNSRAAVQPVVVTPEVFSLLQQARTLHDQTEGAFDVTIAPLVRCWGFMGGGGSLPTPEAVTDARSKVGMNLVHLNAADYSVRFERPGVMLDLGAIGKGYAVEKAVEILREGGVTSALIHGGTSTIYGLGTPPDEESWVVGIDRPPGREGGPGTKPSMLTKVPLRDESLSISAVWGKFFESRGKTFGHVLDPRNGAPVTGALLAAIALPSAMETDALSTALLVSGRAGLEKLARLRPGSKALLLMKSGDGFDASSAGISL